MPSSNQSDEVNELFADIYERLNLQEQAIVELLYDVIALKDALTPEDVARFQKARRKQEHDLGNAVTAEQNRARYAAIISKFRGK